MPLWGKQGYVKFAIHGWTRGYEQVMSQCNYLHSRAIKSNSPHLWSHYKKLKNNVHKKIQKCKAEYYSSENKSNPNARWKTLNEITSRKQVSPVYCIEADEVAHCDNPSMVKILNVHFSTIGTDVQTSQWNWNPSLLYHLVYWIVKVRFQTNHRGVCTQPT